MPKLINAALLTGDFSQAYADGRNCLRILSNSWVRACAFIFAFALLAPSYANGATKGDGPVQPGVQAQTSPVVKAAEESRDSLMALVTSYEQEEEKLAQQNSTLKGLYTDGIISRIQMEASDKKLAETRAKLESLREQVKASNAAIETAKNSPTIIIPSAAMVTGTAIWTTGNSNTDTLIRYYGGKYGVDPYLIYCVMHQESAFRSGATSNKGAMGVMQLMPDTAARFNVTNPYDPAQNIMGGTRYLKFLLELFDGRLDLTLAGYNAGEGAVQKYGNRIPPYSETQDYVRNISKRYLQKPIPVVTTKI